MNAGPRNETLLTYTFSCSGFPRKRKSFFRMASLLLFTSLFHLNVFAQHEKTTSLEELKKLSIEQLTNIEVTLVSRSPQKLTEAASAIQVITNDDIRRSGATNLPEALRLVSNLQVA